MAHDHTELSAYLDGEVTEAERLCIEKRLASDAAYVRELEELERVRKMLSLCMESPDYPIQMSSRILREERRIRKHRNVRLSVGAVAAAFVAVALGFYLGAYVTPPGPGAPEGGGMAAVAPVVPQEAPDDTMVLAEAPAPELTAPPPAASDAALPLQLLGTVTGGQPSALIAVTQGGRKTKSYVPGDTLLEGVTLLEVGHRQVVLEAHGAQVTLGITRSATKDPLDKFVGRWELFQTQQGQEPEIIDQFGVEKEGNKLRVSSSLGQAGALVSCTAEGQYYRFTCEPGTPIPTEALGELNRDVTECDLWILRDEHGNEWPAEMDMFSYRLVRVAPREDGDTGDTKTRVARCVMEVNWMQAALKRYADAHGGGYPENLEELVPDYLEDLELFAETENRKVKYVPGHSTAAPELPARPAEPSLEPLRSYPARSMAFEKQLRALGFTKLLPADVVLDVQYQSPPIGVAALARGGTRTYMLDDPKRYTSSADGMMLLAEMRAACQNNLKQFGLVIHMFKNEHGEFMPPGFLATYPEFLADMSLLTSPLDPPGTESYEYLRPAANYDDMSIDLGKPASKIPLMMNKTEWPGSTPGRNVLFADGHVEYVWSER